MNFKGWNYQAHREFQGEFESKTPSRDNLNREIGRMQAPARRGCADRQAAQPGADHVGLRRARGDLPAAQNLLLVVFSGRPSIVYTRESMGTGGRNYWTA